MIKSTSLQSYNFLCTYTHIHKKTLIDHNRYAHVLTHEHPDTVTHNYIHTHTQDIHTQAHRNTEHTHTFTLKYIRDSSLPGLQVH